MGVLTSRKTTDSLNQKRYEHFIQLHDALQKQGGLLLVFSPENMYNTCVKGKIYDSTNGKWIDVLTPLPDVLYNRFPGRRQERKGHCKNVLKRCQRESIPLFNPHFFSKWCLHQLFSQHTLLKKHLPYTIRYESKQSIEKMLEHHSFVYVKPSEGSKGKGIYRLKKIAEEQLLAETIKQSQLYQNIEEFLNSSLLDENWLVQQGIDSDCINGKRYDLRIIVVRGQGDYHISGIGIRQSGIQNVTTHVPSGGMIVPFSHVSQRLNIPLIRLIASACGHQLETAYGLIGEFSMDMVKSADGHYYILEINAKPMIFDEAEIQQERLMNLCSLFYQLTKFPSPSITTNNHMIN
ncbi:YheC/YheD family protein [Bacillus songklensis]|uniref:YheC/YheD family protein n=1 Tax=Bacillus songklensis TaxID=1069116 RepID=A0ABV8B1N7_9BACI